MSCEGRKQIAGFSTRDRAVGGLAEHRAACWRLLGSDAALFEGDLFEASDLNALAALESSNELARFE